MRACKRAYSVQQRLRRLRRSLASMAKIKKAMKGGSKVAKPSKKGKTNETDEERLLRLEAERLAEEEARRVKEALRLQMLKDRMAQEEKYSRINRLKVLHQWRKLMRLVKARGCALPPQGARRQAALRVVGGCGEGWARVAGGWWRRGRCERVGSARVAVTPSTSSPREGSGPQHAQATLPPKRHQTCPLDPHAHPGPPGPVSVLAGSVGATSAAPRVAAP